MNFGRFGTGYGRMGARRGGAPAVPVFDYYVDSAGGSDGNPGSLAAPFQTLAAVVAVMSNGCSVGLKCGSFWREEISKPTLTGVTIGAYGTGEKPIIDCADLLTTFVAGAQPNTWKVASIVLPSNPTTAHVNVTEDGVLLQGTASEVLCSGDAGSRYVTGHSGTIDLYVHASDNGDPNSNGKVYAYASRLTAITLGSGATVRGIETRNNRSNDGSIVVGDNSLIEYCRARNGGKHNMLAGFGSHVQYNEILEAHNNVENGIPVVIFTSTAPGGTIHSYIEHNTFTLRGLLASPTNQACTYCHTSSGTVTGNLYIRGNTFIDVFGALAAGAANINGVQYWEENYVTISQAYTTMPYKFAAPYMPTAGAGSTSRNKFWFPQPWATTFTASDVLIGVAGTGRTVDDNEFEIGPYFTYAVGSTTGTPGLVSCSGNKGRTFGAAFIYFQNTVTIGDVQNNVIGMGAGRPINTTTTTTITGTIDNNHWQSAIGFRLNNTAYTWANWVGLGYDVNSDAGGDNKAALLDRGDTLAGDIRDWAPWGWLNAQDAASITLSGSDVTAVADLGGRRNFVLHEPSPGADKVQLASVGGRNYFDAVAAGGLKYSSNDFAAAHYVVAVVVYPLAAISAANLIGTVLSLNNGDTQALKPGNVSGTWTNEVVLYQHAGGNGYVYTDAAPSWAANQPHLIVAYYDPETDTVILRIDGDLVGTMTTSSRVTNAPLSGTKAHPQMLLRGNTTANSFNGYIGELFLAGPCSLDAVTEIEAEMMPRWGIL